MRHKGLMRWCNLVLNATVFVLMWSLLSAGIVQVTEPLVTFEGLGTLALLLGFLLAWAARVRVEFG